jgi:hypothetical protein
MGQEILPRFHKEVSQVSNPLAKFPSLAKGIARESDRE